MLKKLSRRYGILINKRILLPAGFFILVLLILFFIPPANSLIIAGMISLISVLVFLTVNWYYPKKIAFLFTLTIFFILLMKSLDVLDPLNSVILASFIIALAVLLFQN